MRIMNFRRFARQISFACFAAFLIEGLNPQAAKAEWFPSLYAGRAASATWTLAPGNYTLEASTFLNLGDINVEIYDPTGRMFARGTQLGGEVIHFSVPQGGEGNFQVRYNMNLCANPMGACMVEINIRRR
jgi:hypothetical protein